MIKTAAKRYFGTFEGLSKEVWLLAWVTLINRAGTMVVPFLSLYLTESLNFTLNQIGWVMSAFGLGSVMGAFIGGKLIPKLGNHKVMVLSLLSSGLAFLLLQFAHSFETFCIGIFLVMVLADAFRPAMFVAISGYSTDENKTRSVTLIRLAINLGFSAGPAIGGFIIYQFGYKSLFYVDGITCILAGIFLLYALQPKRVVEQVKEEVTKQLSPYRDKIFLLFILALVLFCVVFLQFFSTIPLFYKKVHHLTEFEIGLLLGLNGAVIFILEMPLIKRLEDKKKYSESHLMLAGAFLLMFSIWVLNWTSWVGILLVSMLLMTVAEMVAFPFANSYAMNRAKLGKHGDYMALFSIAFSISHIFAHNTGMHLIEKIGFENTWNIFTALGLVSVLFFCLLKKQIMDEGKEQ